VSAALGVALPFWLDRPDDEAVPVLRSILAGDRTEVDGRDPRTHGVRARIDLEAHAAGRPSPRVVVGCQLRSIPGLKPRPN
jgi:hypothetical protein